MSQRSRNGAAIDTQAPGGPSRQPPHRSIHSDDSVRPEARLSGEGDKQGDSDDEYTLSAFGDVSLTAEYTPPEHSSGKVSLRPKVRRPPLPNRRHCEVSPEEDDNGSSYSRALLRSHIRSVSALASPRADFNALLETLRLSRNAERRTNGDFVSARDASSRSIAPTQAPSGSASLRAPASRPGG